MPSLWCAATCGWRLRVFHCPPPTLIYGKSRPLCTTGLSIPLLTPLELRKVQGRGSKEKCFVHRSNSPAAYLTYLSSRLPETSVRFTGREVSFSLLGVETFTYTVTAASVEGPHGFHGWNIDADKLRKQVLGGSVLTVSHAPRVSVTASSGTSVRPNSPVPATATFSEPVFGFTIDGIIAANGAVSNFAGSGAVYTFDVTPIPPKR